MRAYPRNQESDPARDRLIAEHVDMARRIALHVARRLPPWLQEEDVIAASMVGLTEAAERYDDKRGEPFVAFAEKRIRGAVLDELRRGDLLPRRKRMMARKIGQTIRDLEHRLCRAPEDEEIARALGVPLETYHEELEQLTHITFVEIFDDVPGETSDPLAVGPVVAVERAQLVERLHECLGRLPERDATVLSLYYVEELDYCEIGEVLGVSESRVCQLHARAMTRLRAEFSRMDEGK